MIAESVAVVVVLVVLVAVAASVVTAVAEREKGSIAVVGVNSFGRELKKYSVSAPLVNSAERAVKPPTIKPECSELYESKILKKYFIICILSPVELQSRANLSYSRELM